MLPPLPGTAANAATNSFHPSNSNHMHPFGSHNLPMLPQLSVKPTGNDHDKLMLSPTSKSKSNLISEQQQQQHQHQLMLMNQFLRNVSNHF
jgi:hypothetical protein